MDVFAQQKILANKYRRRSEQPVKSTLEYELPPNRSLSPERLFHNYNVDVTTRDDLKKSLAKMYWETKADMLDINEETLQLKMRICDIKAQFLHVLKTYENMESQHFPHNPNYTVASKQYKTHKTQPLQCDKKDTLQPQDKFFNKIPNGPNGNKLPQSESNHDILDLYEEDKRKDFQIYKSLEIDNFSELELDVSINEQIEKLHLYNEKKIDDEKYIKENKNRDNFNNEDLSVSGISGRDENESEPIHSSHKFNSSKGSGDKIRSKINTTSSQSDRSASTVNHNKNQHACNLSQEEKILNTQESNEKQIKWGPDPEKIRNEAGLPLMNPLLRKWLESQQERVEPLQTHNVMDLSNHYEAPEMKSLIESFPDITENEHLISMGSSLLDNLEKDLGERSKLSLSSKSNNSASSGPRRYSRFSSSCMIKKGSSQTVGLNQTEASDTSGAWDGVVINQVEFPSQSENRNSSASLNPDIFPLTKSRNSEPDLSLSNSDKPNSFAKHHSVALLSKLDSTHEISFDQSMKDISDITRCSDVTSSRIQESQTDLKQKVNSQINEPAPQHSTPEKEKSDGLNIPKYTKRSQSKPNNTLGNRTSPAGSDNTPKVIRNKNLTSSTGQYAPQLGCNKDHSSSGCSCFDDSTPIAANNTKRRRSLRNRKSLGGKSDFSADDGSDNTPVVCRHGKVKPGFKTLTSGINCSGLLDDSGQLTTPTATRDASPASYYHRMSRDQYLQDNEDGSRFYIEGNPINFQENYDNDELGINNDIEPPKTSQEISAPTDPADGHYSMEVTRDSEAHASIISVPCNDVDPLSSDISDYQLHMSGLSSCQDSSYKESDSSVWSANNSDYSLPDKAFTKQELPKQATASTTSSASDIHVPVNSPNSTDTGNQASASASYMQTASSFESLSGVGRLNLQQSVVLKEHARSLDVLDVFNHYEEAEEANGAHQGKNKGVMRAQSIRPAAIGTEVPSPFDRTRSKSMNVKHISTKKAELKMECKLPPAPPPISTIPKSNEYLEFKAKMMKERTKDVRDTSTQSSSADDSHNVDLHQKKRKSTILKRIKNIGKHFRTNSITKQKACSGQSENEDSK